MQHSKRDKEQQQQQVQAGQATLSDVQRGTKGVDLQELARYSDAFVAIPNLQLDVLVIREAEDFGAELQPPTLVHLQPMRRKSTVTCGTARNGIKLLFTFLSMVTSTSPATCTSPATLPLPKAKLFFALRLP